MNNEPPSSAPTPDPAALQQRIAALEQELATVRDQFDADRLMAQQENQRLRVFEELVEHSHDSIIVADMQGHLTYMNRAWHRLSGYGDELGMPFLSMIVPEDHEAALDGFRATVEHGTWEGRLSYLRADGSTFVGLVSTFLIADDHEESTNAVAFIRDVTAQVQAEAEREALQQQVILMQQHALRELATPLIPVADGVVVLPLVGSMNGERTQQVMEVLLEGIVTHQAEFAILDVTGVRVMDTYVAQGLLRVAQAAKLLGTQVIITGISADIAQTLVHLGADLSDLTTHSNLQRGIAYALGNN